MRNPDSWNLLALLKIFSGLCLMFVSGNFNSGDLDWTYFGSQDLFCPLVLSLSFFFLGQFLGLYPGPCSQLRDHLMREARIFQRKSCGNSCQGERSFIFRSWDSWLRQFIGLPSPWAAPESLVDFQEGGSQASTSSWGGEWRTEEPAKTRGWRDSQGEGQSSHRHRSRSSWGRCLLPPWPLNGALPYPWCLCRKGRPGAPLGGHVGGLQGHLQVWCFVERARRTQQILASLLKICVYPQINTCSAFAVIHRHV